MPLAAKDFLFQLQLLVARTGSDLSLRKSMLADARSTLIANGLIPPAGLKFKAHENKNKAVIEESDELISIALPEFSQPDSTAGFLTPKEIAPIRVAIVSLEATEVSTVVVTGTGDDGGDEPKPTTTTVQEVQESVAEVCSVEVANSVTISG
jgi:hypothetical protein